MVFISQRIINLAMNKMKNISWKRKVRHFVFYGWRRGRYHGAVGLALKDTVREISGVGGFHNGRGNGRNSSENIRECQWSRQPNVV